MENVRQEEIQEAYGSYFPLEEYFGFDIRPYITVVRFESGEKIMEEGTQPSFLYYLVEGRAKLLLSHENGRISLINFLNAPCFIGEMELLGAQDTANGVTAITSCTCFAIRVRDCKGKLLNDTIFLRHLCLFLSRKAIGNTYNYSLNQSYPLEVRLANFILMTEHAGIYREKHSEAAEFLGVTYRHLLYVLADFVKRGILKKTKQGYCIMNCDILKEIADTGKP